ncbi:hypothetical protein GWI33_023345, partial [Rhynchophorus ferrugineus]
MESQSLFYNKFIPAIPVGKNWCIGEVCQNPELYNESKIDLLLEISKPKMMKLFQSHLSSNSEFTTKPREQSDITQFGLKRPDLLPQKPNNEIYLELRMQRDVACARMYQASNALIQIKTMDNNENGLNVLVTERVLLET